MNTRVWLSSAPETAVLGSGHLAQKNTALIFLRRLVLLILCFGVSGLSAQTITYYGGWVIPSAHVYFIWYGNWNGDTGSIILPDLVNGMNGSAYLNVLTSYTGKIFPSSFGPVTTNVTFGGQVWDWYSYGTVLDEPTTKDLIQSHLPQFGTDPYGVYILFTSADVDVSGTPDSSSPTGYSRMCYEMCGYHNHTFRDNINMLHAVVGNPQRCANLGLFTCGFPASVSPNDNTNADAMASTVAHEYAEIVTDPNADSWHTNTNPWQEMGDLCQFPDFNATYGPTFATGNGSPANVTLGGRNFLLQQLWASTGGCTLSYTPPPPPPSGGGGGGGCATVPLNPASSGTPATQASTINRPLPSSNTTPFSQPVNGKQNPHPKSSTTTPSSGITVAGPTGQVKCAL